MNTLHYPFLEPPVLGQSIQVARGVHWLRMPLPFILDHINLYLLEDQDGWYIIDAGAKDDRAKSLWKSYLHTHLGDKPLKGVIATHMHPDHFGLAGWLADLHAVPLMTTEEEYRQAQIYAEAAGENFIRLARAHYAKHGFDSLFTNGHTPFRYPNYLELLPMTFKPLSEDDLLVINGRTWQVFIGRGHSPAHVSLYCEEDRLLISGDQVLPNISPNVGVWPHDPDTDPLADWFDSLKRLKEIAPNTLVLPAHNTPFLGLHQRLKELAKLHETRLAKIRQECNAPRTIAELLPILFSSLINRSHLHLAIAEALAHVHYLMSQGQLLRTLNEEGILCYQAVDP